VVRRKGNLKPAWPSAHLFIKFKAEFKLHRGPRDRAGQHYCHCRVWKEPGPTEKASGGESGGWRS
jgi:hypothetical protein